ncbi:extracellular solute-binding protein [Cohnella lupini]|uniref:Aldotetraouronic acid ABC transporter substrate-binding protein /aldotetraouronic acid ABC transporter substrate-binding protein n=1 Tax=Cohnella lupini TaxID=1294267 RepID=A0A3D9IJF0_9BACL|nr:extracellular solute-binding protein [Cohnella lupini]RED61890.1 aldotetraouronic acid ABC transporter substrate-binding protein /aldotetraouronic acid ABC transporter substrate-binding protein [Cohnella lupini]
MKKRLAKHSLGALALAVAVLSAAGCSAKSNANQTEPSSTSGASGDNSQQEVTVKLGRVVGSDNKFKNGETIEDNVHTRWAKEKFGIDFKVDWSVGTGEAYTTKLRLLMNSNGDLPDVFTLNDPTLENQVVDSGKVMDVTEAFDKYASPRLKELYAKYPEIWNTVSYEGKHYGLPTFNAISSFSVLWIRQDWLDKLGLQVPKTIEDMDKVMDAFVNQDPDGNGKKDTIGLSLSLKKGVSTVKDTFMVSSDFLFGHSAVPTYWTEGADGKLQYGSVQPTMKQGLAKLSEWMKKGYLDKDAGAMDESKAAESFVQGKSGMVFGPTWMPTFPFNADMKFDYIPVPVPAGIDGQIGFGSEPQSSVRFYFNKDFKHMDVLFQYLDAIMGPGLYDPSSEFANGWAEGYDYVMVDGKPVYDSDKIPGGFVDVKKYTIYGNDIQAPKKELEVMAKLGRGEAPETPYENYFAARPKKWAEAAAVLDTYLDQAAVFDKFTGPPTPTMAEKGELLRKMENEIFLKIIYGQESPDAFDSFVNKWKSSGGDQITKEVNEWYESVNQ